MLVCFKRTVIFSDQFCYIWNGKRTLTFCSVANKNINSTVTERILRVATELQRTCGIQAGMPDD